MKDIPKMSIYLQDESSIEIDKKTWRIILPRSWLEKIMLKWFENLHNSRHIFGFLGIDWKVYYSIRKWKKSNDFTYSLSRLLEKDKSKYKIIILDNASIHKSKKVRKYCEERNIILVYLPPYSPDLNPIEIMRKIVKRKFRNRQWEVWPSLEQKIRNAMNSLWNQSSLLNFWKQKYLPKT